jgi:hypothetical protein
MKSIENDDVVKVTMKVYKKGKVVHVYRQTKRRDFIWYFNRAKHINLDNKVVFRVEYGKGDNVKDCYSVEDLKWCYQTFYKEYL